MAKDFFDNIEFRDLSLGYGLNDLGYNKFMSKRRSSLGNISIKPPQGELMGSVDAREVAHGMLEGSNNFAEEQAKKYEQLLTRMQNPDAPVVSPNSNNNSTSNGGSQQSPDPVDGYSPAPALEPRNMEAGSMSALVGHNKLDFSDNSPGFLMGVDRDGTYKFLIGDSNSSMDWQVTSANTLTVKGSLVAGEIHIPDKDTTANSFHTNTGGDSWWGATESDFNSSKDNANAYIENSGAATFHNITADGGTIGGWTLGSNKLSTNNITLDSANEKITVGSSPSIDIEGANTRIRSSNYSAGTFGSGFTLEPDLLEVGNIAARGKIRTSVFQKDNINSVGGNLFVSQGADVLDADMSSADTENVTITGDITLAVGDIIRIKEGTDDEWLEIAGTTNAPTYDVNRDKAGSYAADSNPAWTKGATVTNFGQSGDGGAFITGSQSNAPYLEVFDHSGSPWSDMDTKIRLGNLNGFLSFSSDKYGIAIGESGENMSYNPTDGLSILGAGIDTANSGARVRILPDSNTGIQVIDDTGTDVFKALVGGTDVGDVIVGDESTNSFIKYDKSEDELLGVDVKQREAFTAGESLSQGDWVIVGSGDDEFKTIDFNQGRDSVDQETSKFSQTFTTNVLDHTITQATIYQFGTTDGSSVDIEVWIEDPNGNVITSKHATSISGGLNTRDFVFSTPGSVDPNTSGYQLVVDYISGSTELEIGIDDDNSYSGGSYQNDGLGGWDIFFKIITKKTESGKVYKTDADSTNKSGNPGELATNCVGVVDTGASKGNEAQVMVFGVPDFLSGLTAGEKHFLSNTRGQISTSAGSFSQEVGRALTTSQLKMHIP